MSSHHSEPACLFTRIKRVRSECEQLENSINNVSLELTTKSLIARQMIFVHIELESLTCPCVQDAEYVHVNRVRAELEAAKQTTKDEDDVSVSPSVAEHILHACD